MKFRMVDRILEYEPKVSIKGVKTVSFEEYNLKAAFGEPEQLPKSLLVEAFFQLGNWLVMLSSDFVHMALVTRFEEIRFGDVLRPGEAVTMDVTVRRFREDGIVFDGVGMCGKKHLVSGLGCLAVPVPLAEYHDPADLRVLFSEIHRPKETVIR